MSDTAHTSTKRDKTYFVSDMHLGAAYIDDWRGHEGRVVRMLQSFEKDCKTLYLLGDILDYWFEYRTVVPRGYIRFFGQLARMSDMGIKIVWFIGNHDIWLFDYLRDQIGMEVIDGNVTRDIDGKRFFLGHGDALYGDKRSFRILRAFFRNRLCQKLYSGIHPRWTIPFAHRWSRHSRGVDPMSHPVVADPEKERFIIFARGYLAQHPDIDFFVLGHRHIALDYPIDNGTHVVILGDCFAQFTYAVFDGNSLQLLHFTDGQNAN